MPATSWVQLVGPKDGVADETITVLVSSGGTYSTDVTFLSGDFPTVPAGTNAITGVEFRVSAVASHPGVEISAIALESSWSQANAPFLTLFFSANNDRLTPSFAQGDESDLVGTDYVAAGGYAAIIPDEIRSGDYTGANVGIDRYAHWTGGSLTALGHPGNPLVLDYRTVLIGFVSTEGYNATLYVDSIEFRLHYVDASTTAMSGTGTMSATLSKAAEISTDMVGTGVTTAVANGYRVIASNMEGSGKIAPVISRDVGGVIYRYIMPEMYGVGSVTTVKPIIYRPIATAIRGTGLIESSLSIGRNIMAPSRNGPLALTGTGIVGKELLAQRFVSSAMVGTGIVSGGPLAVRKIVAAMAGTGVMAASAIATRPIAAPMVGTGVMAETIQAGRISQPVNMDGTGVMGSTMLAKRPIASSMTGTGVVDAELTINTRLAAPDGRTFMAPPDAFAFIAPPDFQTFEATE